MGSDMYILKNGVTVCGTTNPYLFSNDLFIYSEGRVSIQKPLLTDMATLRARLPATSPIAIREHDKVYWRVLPLVLHGPSWVFPDTPNCPS